MPSPEFFNVLPVEPALNNLFQQWQPELHTEQIDPRKALGRILAKQATSPISLPEFRRSTVDGYAVIASDTFGASASLPAYLTLAGTVHMGQSAEVDIEPGQLVEIHTGGMLPDSADAVVMVENTQSLDTGEIEILSSVSPGENVIQVGEDVEAGTPILEAGHRLRPQDIGGLLAVGITSVEVIRAPRIGILSCGDEIVLPEETPRPGQIRDINAHTLAALVEQAGAEPVLLGIARDTFDDYLAHAKDGFAQSDVLVMTAGSSVSTRDYTRDVIQQLGKPGVIQHGLAVKPGKPSLIAVCDNKPVVGLPGNPVSALLVARQIVMPIIQRLLGEQPRFTRSIQATLKANVASQTGRDDSVPVRLTEEGDTYFAEPVFGKSNLIYTLVNADGILPIPLNSNGFKAGTVVEIVLFD